MEYTFIAKGYPLRKIPPGATVEVLRFFPRRRALVLYRGERILTFTTLLRRRKRSAGSASTKP